MDHLLRGLKVGIGVLAVTVALEYFVTDFGYLYAVLFTVVFTLTWVAVSAASDS